MSQADVDNYYHCPNCGAGKPEVWSNASGDLRCDNCGWEDQEEEECA